MKVSAKSILIASAVIVVSALVFFGYRHFEDRLPGDVTFDQDCINQWTAYKINFFQAVGRGFDNRDMFKPPHWDDYGFQTALYIAEAINAGENSSVSFERLPTRELSQADAIFMADHVSPHQSAMPKPYSSFIRMFLNNEYLERFVSLNKGNRRFWLNNVNRVINGVRVN